MKYVRFIAMLLLIIGALNWGSIGLFDFDFISHFSGAVLSRLIFILVGLAGLCGITRLCCKSGCGCNCGSNCKCCKK